MLFAGFPWLRNRSLVRTFRSMFPSRSHFFKRRSCRRRLFFARLGFSRPRCRRRRLGEDLLGRLNHLFQRFWLFLTGDDHFLRMYSPDDNDPAK
jgi:hypothetical protein